MKVGAGMVTSSRKSPWHLGWPSENENKLGGGPPAGEDLVRKTGMTRRR